MHTLYPVDMIISLARRLRPLPVEQLVLLVPGEPPAFGAFGSSNHAEFPDDLYALARHHEGASAFLHNHPKSGPPSKEDLDAAWDLDCIEMHVVTFDGFLWSIYKEPKPLWWQMGEIALKTMIETAQAAAAKLAPVIDPAEKLRAANEMHREAFARALPSARLTRL